MGERHVVPCVQPASSDGNQVVHGRAKRLVCRPSDLPHEPAAKVARPAIAFSYGAPRDPLVAASDDLQSACLRT